MLTGEHAVTVRRARTARADTLVIIPALNEQAALPGVLAALRTRLPDVDVLVVDDGSSDATAEVAAAGGAMVARLPFNLGTGGALRTGFRFAARTGYERAIQFDADGQHDAAEIAALTAQLDEGADLVIGSRFAREAQYDAGAVRMRAMGVLRIALAALSGRRFTDTSSGFRAFSRRMLEFYASTYPLEYLSDTVEALLIACYAGFTVVEVPVRMHQRSGGTPSTKTLRLVYQYVRLLVALAAMASVRRRTRRKAVR